MNRSGKKIGVAIVAPSGYAPDETALERGIAVLQQQGCTVHSYYHPPSKFHRFGGSDEARVAQFHAAADNPDVQVVLALRGGYGLSRILPALDFKRLAAANKLYVGHSDFTVFHLALLAQTGATSFAGPMLCDDFTRGDPCTYTMQHFWGCLNASSYTVVGNGNGNPVVDLSGILWGGNLTMVAHLAGTPYFPEVEGGILFLEDINEHPYRVERMLIQLLQSGVLARQKAILLGDFSSFKLTDYDNGYDFNAMLAWIRTQVSVPILTGLPFGHLREKVTLPVGCTAHLTCDGSPFKLALSNYAGLVS